MRGERAGQGAGRAVRAASGAGKAGRKKKQREKARRAALSAAKNAYASAPHAKHRCLTKVVTLFLNSNYDILVNGDK